MGAVLCFTTPSWTTSIRFVLYTIDCYKMGICVRNISHFEKNEADELPFVTVIIGALIALKSY